MGIRTGRQENLFIEQRPPTPTGELHHRVLRFNASRTRSAHHHPPEKRTTGCFARPRLQTGHRIPRDEREIYGRWPPGPREADFGGGKLDSLFFSFLFSFTLCLILLVAQAEGVGDEGAATEPALGCIG